MNWIVELLRGGSIAGAVLILSVVIVLGLAIGNLRVRGVGLGITGVLFSGLLFGHFGVSLEPDVMEFIREFGLILFVYTVGLQVGPSFKASFRREGLPLNLLAASVVLTGAVLALAGAWALGIDIPVAVGVLAGATTNTPSLAAAQSTLSDLGAEGATKLPGLGYAVAYPFGVIGTILAMLSIRGMFRIDPASEQARLDAERGKEIEPLERVNLRVENPNLEGLRLGEISLFEDSGVIISRVGHGAEQHVATADTVLHMGDLVLAVGPRQKLHALRLLVGQKTDEDLSKAPSAIETRQLIVTQKKVVGSSVRELRLRERYETQITRLSRAGVELPVGASLRLQYGDRLLAVGEPANLDKVAAMVGNSARALNYPDVIPVFAGIFLGVLLGSLPLHVPGAPAPVKLGLAGGPLLAAILLSQIQRIGPLVWYLPESANYALREFGIVLFLACVGLRAGDAFLETLLNGDGFIWMSAGAVITFVPLVVTGAIARAALKINYLRICGLLAGSMTDPPALAFAGAMTQSEAPTVSYAAVYPLTMILRVVVAQLIVLLFIV